ncbi:unnamed protein product [Chondrus crispus]|uniref:Uncharacterized protein n=1 Tax=Chondrus crispus TaxID=2769 RepID=R7QLA7_CHOCR|nr:unnamed protein product [Chondrus crispus]CDF38869.1 unnamed protein product [Chondrus crispus]|eukprot:XP_005718774.1 unnamed protein product [Chondrus crispus]
MIADTVYGNARDKQTSPNDEGKQSETGRPLFVVNVTKIAAAPLLDNFHCS